MEDKKSLKRLDYTSSREALGEHFHMSEDLLAEINPGNKFDRVGDKINVAGLSADKKSSKVSRIEVDKGRETVRTLAQDGTLVAFYPASIGSEEKPTPSGTLKVVSIEPNPTYRYDPKYKFKGVESTKPFTINAGPNNPVGTMWIGLSENGYGIHGTAEPSRVSKSESHGCVRMTNWDVERLAKSIRKGVEVVFVEGKQAALVMPKLRRSTSSLDNSGKKALPRSANLEPRGQQQFPPIPTSGHIGKQANHRWPRCG